MDFGKAVRRRRQALGLTLEEFAERASLSTNYVGTIENGRRDPSLSAVTAIAKALGVSASELLGARVATGEALELARLFDAVPGEHQAPLLALVRSRAAGGDARARPTRPRRTWLRGRHEPDERGSEASAAEPRARRGPRSGRREAESRIFSDILAKLPHVRPTNIVADVVVSAARLITPTRRRRCRAPRGAARCSSSTAGRGSGCARARRRARRCLGGTRARSPDR
ncbi:MAG: helix-turn-helix transcriptional regulator [Polyangiaceae bacterium]|nr:helix-turn-helix transcriptional regulator [Polyangiaceae bacterium]